MIRRNLSQQSLTKQSARVSITKKLPSDFFMPFDSTKVVPFRRLKKVSNLNNQNQFMNMDKKSFKDTFAQRKISFQFTFYRCPNNEQKVQQSRLVKQKSSKKEILQKFNIKLPYIRSAQSGVERRKKLHKVRRSTNFNTDSFNDSSNIPFNDITTVPLR